MRNQWGDRLRVQDVCTVKPYALPVDLAAVKAHLRIAADLTDEDALLSVYLQSAVESVEVDAGRALVMQTRCLYLDQWPVISPAIAGLDQTDSVDLLLARAPAVQVDEITYTDESGAVQTLDAEDYAVNTADEPCRVRYSWGSSWPAARQQEKSICVTYKAGYVIPFTADAASDVITLRGQPAGKCPAAVCDPVHSAIDGRQSTQTDYYVVQSSGNTCKLSTSEGGGAVNLSSAGTGLHFLGELDSRAVLAVLLRVGMLYVDREGAEYEQCRRGYWAQIHALRHTL